VYCLVRCYAKTKARKLAMMPIMLGKRRDAMHATAAAKQAAYRNPKRNESTFLVLGAKNGKTLRIAKKRTKSMACRTTISPRTNRHSNLPHSPSIATRATTTPRPRCQLEQCPSVNEEAATFPT